MEVEPSNKLLTVSNIEVMASYATPDTPLAVSAFAENKLNGNTYFTQRGRHLHFTWNRVQQKLLFVPLGSEGASSFDPAKLPRVHLGEGRFSKEGVSYHQLTSNNPNILHFRIDGGQFGYWIGPDDNRRLEFANAFEFHVQEERTFPDGSLVELELLGSGHIDAKIAKWPKDSKSKGPIVCCKGPHVFGQPAMGPTPLPPPLVRRASNAVKGAIRRITGQKKDTPKRLR
ncbi:hypothetical protein HYFRA_00003032 [Hymenoscyphus fraxineus]|uniref:Uncharacterized protein n=1 Tax=Hymenoscyphus fraxineus TaxID=746836 RepID=A0A9N9KP96_9HELO|nr:hypothetical protein HYFRA_00003032 [Hymenoscyphus fraxineus]